MTTAIDLYLDLAKKPDPTPTVFAKQNDVLTRMLRLHLTENGRSWPMPEDARPAIVYRKADGTGGSFDTLPDGSPAFTALEDGLTLTVAPQMLTCEGMVKCQLVLLTDTGRLSTFGWRMYVEHDLAQSGPSEDYYRLTTLKGLQEALDALGKDLAGLRENNGLEIDLTQDFASSGMSDPLQYLLDRAGEYANNALLRLAHDGSAYTARCIRTAPGGDGCQYVEITDYSDDGFVEKYVYCNGELETNIGYAAPATGGKAPYLSVQAAVDAVGRVGKNTEAIATATAFITEAQNDIHDLYGATEGLDKRLTLLENVATVESWADVQKIVRAGLASRYFAIGDQLQCKRGDTVLTWDVIGIDHDTPADPKWSHSMTLQLHDCFTALQFDSREALFFAEEALPAGTYNFTVTKHPWVSSNVNKTFQFTLTQGVPAGGQIMLMANYNDAIAGSSVMTFASATNIGEIETAAVSEGAEGTSLGDVCNDVSGNTNSAQRNFLGNNNYNESAMKQYLNSASAAGGVWAPQNKFDRPPSWAASEAGFLNGMDEDFLSVIGEVMKKTVLNVVSDVGGSTEAAEKFFLLSRSEVYGGNEAAGGEGSAYPYYANYSDLSAEGVGDDANRIKRIKAEAQNWWLRSPVIGNAYDIRPVGPTGGIKASAASYSRGVAPACCVV